MRKLVPLNTRRVRRLGVLAAALASAASAPALAAPLATTRTGIVSGHVVGGAEVFEGVPYAAPPLGWLRWAPPEAPAAWTGVREATRPGAACPQPGPAGGQGGNVPSEDEDCLSVNLWRPAATRPGARLPVIVWFHGGGMVYGAGHLFRASRLARGGRAIVVTVNYRLGILGFFAHPALDAEQPATGSGNYGLLDQQAALRWVRDNIAAFGGDPKRVTIAGESGGAQSVCLQLASPLARGLFQRAITQSGPCQFVFPRLRQSQAVGVKTADRLGCGGSGAAALACLRSAPIGRLLANMVPGAGAAGNGPSVGGGVLPWNVREAIAFGRWNRVPVLQGANSDEGLWRVLPNFDGAGRPVTPDNYVTSLQGFFGAAAGEVARAYPVASYARPSLALARAVGDSGITYRIGACNTLLAHRLLAPATALYAYEFADPDAPFPFEAYKINTAGVRGAGHTAELSYLFDTQDELTPAQQDLSRRMIGYWANFAASSDPNGRGLPTWPRFTSQAEWVQVLRPDGTRSERTLEDKHQCMFWEELGLNTLSSFERVGP